MSSSLPPVPLDGVFHCGKLVAPEITLICRGNKYLSIWRTSVMLFLVLIDSFIFQ